MTNKVDAAAATVAGIEAKIAAAQTRIAELDAAIRVAAYDATTDKPGAAKRVTTLQADSLAQSQNIGVLNHALTEARSRLAQAEHQAEAELAAELRERDTVNAAALRDAGFAADAALAVFVEEVAKFQRAHAALGATRPHIRGALFDVNMKRALETAGQSIGLKGRVLAPSERLRFADLVTRMVGPAASAVASKAAPADTAATAN